MASPTWKQGPETLPVAEMVSTQHSAVTCKERVALLGMYKIASSLSAQWSLELHSKSDGCSDFEFDQIRQRAEDAKHQLKVAFNQLEQHVADHGCRSEPSHHVSDYHVAPENAP